MKLSYFFYCNMEKVIILSMCIFSGVKAKKASVYESSYVYLNVRNLKTNMQHTFCVNYEQWRNREIAESLDEASPLRLGWWGGIVDNTNVCVKNNSLNYYKKAVALNYRLERKDGSCAIPFVSTNTSFKKAFQFEVNELMSQNASAGIILVEKGLEYTSRWSDYLFSEFYDPDFNQSTELPTFFMYKHVFFDELLRLSGSRGGSELLLKFYRPRSFIVGLSMFIIWSIAVFCVTVGGFWASHRKLIEDRSDLEANVEEIDHSDPLRCKKMKRDEETTPINCFFIIILMLAVVGVLMIGFYFRTITVFVFNITLVALGTFSVHRCLTALFGSFFKCGHCRVCISMNDVTRSIFRRDLFNCEGCSERPRVISLLIFTLAAAFCITWFFLRRNTYAFLMLDFINITLCLHVLKGIRFQKLKWLAILLLCMFIYDLFMVFITPFITKNGCSVMVEVAAGIDCSKSDYGYPVAPINVEIPEKFPMLFQVPRLSDPMISCIDIEIEKEYRPVILGLGDVIVPGYLISYCFTVDFAVKTRYLYGIVSIVGYGIGLIITFIALTLMNIAQPALIYLIPFTFLPIVLLALLRHELKMLWNGDFPPKDKIRGAENVNGINSNQGSVEHLSSSSRTN